MKKEQVQLMEAVKREGTGSENRLWGVKISTSGLESCNDIPTLLFTISVTFSNHGPSLPQCLNFFIYKVGTMNVLLALTKSRCLVNSLKSLTWIHSMVLFREDN